MKSRFPGICDWEAFDCGDTALNAFLRRHARKSHERGGAKRFLAINDGDGKTIQGIVPEYDPQGGFTTEDTEKRKKLCDLCGGKNKTLRAEG